MKGRKDDTARASTRKMRITLKEAHIATRDRFSLAPQKNLAELPVSPISL
jgi:hypothetical protein